MQSATGNSVPWLTQALATVWMAAVSTLAAAQDAVHLRWLDDHYAQTAQTAKALWEYAEVGYQETRSSALLQEQLADAGFSVEAAWRIFPRPLWPVTAAGRCWRYSVSSMRCRVLRRTLPRAVRWRTKPPATPADTISSAPARPPRPWPSRPGSTRRAHAARSASTARRRKRAAAARSTWFAPGSSTMWTSPCTGTPRTQLGGGAHDAGQSLGQVPLYRRIGARGGRAGPRALGAGWRRGHELHGQHHA
jgi:hypothetical protein